MKREVRVFTDKSVQLKMDEVSICCLFADAKALADDIYEKLGIHLPTCVSKDRYDALLKEFNDLRSNADMRCENLREKIHEKDAEITSLIAEKKLAQRSAWDLDSKLKDSYDRIRELENSEPLRVLRVKNEALRKALDQIVVEASRATW